MLGTHRPDPAHQNSQMIPQLHHTHCLCSLWGIWSWMSCYSNLQLLPLKFLAMWSDMHLSAPVSTKKVHIEDDILVSSSAFHLLWLIRLHPEWLFSAAFFLHLHSLSGEKEHKFLGVLYQLFHRPCTATFCISFGLWPSWSIAVLSLVRGCRQHLSWLLYSSKTVNGILPGLEEGL